MKLQQTVNLPTAGDGEQVISNPYDNNSLLGMLQILKDNYVQLNLVTFKAKLIEILNSKLQPHEMHDPEIGIQCIERKLQEWNSQNMSQYFTQDIFWTVCFLRQYDTHCDLYKKSLEHVVQFIHKQSSEHALLIGTSTSTMLYPGKPIFSNLIDWIKSVYILTSKEKEKGQNNGQSKYNNNKSQNNNSNTKQYQQKQQHLRSSESAFVAQPDTVQFNKLIAINSDEVFDREVLRSDARCILDQNGKKILYTATVGPCEQCCEESHEHQKPQCYVKKCNRCKHFGHKSNNCKQKV